MKSSQPLALLPGRGRFLRLRYALCSSELQFSCGEKLPLFAWFDVAPLAYAIRLQRGIRLAECRGMQVERLANLCRGGAAVAHEVIRVQKRTPERLLVCSGVHLPDALTPGSTFCRSFGEVTTTSQILPWSAIRRKRDCYSVAIYAWRGA